MPSNLDLWNAVQKTDRQRGTSVKPEGGEVIGTEIVHVVRVDLWYMQGGNKAKVTQFGQTTFVGHNKYSVFTDEEAPKKSLTDAMSKCLSLLGFGSDIHMGLWDDVKYVKLVGLLPCAATGTPGPSDTHHLIEALWAASPDIKAMQRAVLRAYWDSQVRLRGDVK